MVVSLMIASVRVRSRWDDCDRYGHVNNAAYLALVRAAHDRAGIWHHEIRCADQSLVAADRARGAFLDLEGGIRTAPQELLDDLLRGEPAA